MVISLQRGKGVLTVDWTSRVLRICLLVVIGLLSTSCRQAEMAFPEPNQYTDSKAGEYVSQQGELSVDNHSYVAEFGILTVPENRDNSNESLLHLPVLRIRADSPEKYDPVFLLAGGPGSPNIHGYPPAWMLKPKRLK